jgi:hypothetical protein
MAYSVNKLDVWTAEIEDRVGGLSAKLASLAEAGADLQFVIARRRPEAPGRGVVFLSGVKGTKITKAAESAGLTKTTDLAALRVEEPNKPGGCHKLTRLLADAGISLRGLSAAVIGAKCATFVAFDSEADADRAAKVLRGAGKK